MKKTTRRTGLSKRLEQVQANAQRAIGRGYEATLELLPPRSRKAVEELASQIETTAEDLTARGRQALKAMEKRGQALQGRVESRVKAFARRGDRTRAAVERRGTNLVATVEQRVARVLKPLARRLDIATASELERLSKRLAQLERKLSTGTRRAAA
jgi:hypothetical protein